MSPEPSEAAYKTEKMQDVQIMSIIGDQARFTCNDVSQATDIHDKFTGLIELLFGKPVSIGSIAGTGLVSQSFNGRYDDLHADKHYKGEILTHIGIALKSRPRHQSSLQILQP